jgi:hypothetical protein
MKRLPTVTLEFARTIVEEETGASVVLPSEIDPADELAAGNGENGDLKLIARDAKKNPLFSKLRWTDQAAERILRVPVGYMRKRTQERVEALAGENGSAEIDLTLVEAGLEIGRRLMDEVLGEQEAVAESETTPQSTRAGGNGNARQNGNGKQNSDLYLNEVSLLSAMAARRKADARDS